ncbi:MAG: hypothetical protein JNK04_20335 [Myxococcales bacterium]|nr:hypothetical protein [Myxococcales bacterium]
MTRASFAVVALVACACVEPSQARVAETPEQLLNDDCADYKPVKGVMPGAPAPKSAAEGEAPPAPADARCSGSASPQK